MGGGGINTSATRLEALNIQSSTAGAVTPWLRGMHRIPGNLVWYGDFKATPRTQKTGGKGGGSSTSTTYSYSASLVMGICHGTVHSVPRVWKGKSVTTPSGLGLTVLSGAIGQAQWSGLLGRGEQTLNYSGLAAVAALNYSLGESASVENHSFEVRHSSAYAVDASTPDVDPSAAAYDLLTHPHQGAALPLSIMGDWSAWSNYCIANNLLVSPLLTTQSSAREALQAMADLTNTGIVWSDGKLKMRPRGDQAAAAYGRTFTPDTTPVYQIDDNCYIKQGDGAPVTRSLKSPAERYNIVKLQYRDRANGYNPAVVEAKDITDIAANGARPMNVIEAEWICAGDVARFVAEIRKQRELFVEGEYTFRLPWHYALIECMDLLTISDSTLLLDNVPVRVKSIVEESDEELSITCEDYPAGVASAPLYASQGMTGFAMNANVSPGNALAPVIFEAPGSRVTTGLEILVATAGSNANWGGCEVWASYDGTSYQRIGTVRGGARYGTLTAALGASGSSASVQINGGQLQSGSATDAAALATLCYLGGANPEYIAYQGATLTSPNNYTLGSLVRGAYDLPAAAHASGDPFVRVDSAVVSSGPLDMSQVGSVIYVKLTSFNVFGGAQQSLAEVSPYAYTITGHFVVPAPAFRLKASALAFSFSSSGTPVPASQVITVTLDTGGAPGVAAWAAELFNDSDVSLGSATLGGSGNVRNLTVASFGGARRCVITAALSGVVDEVTILRIRDGGAGTPGTPGTQSAQVYLYQWSTATPPDPTGQSTYTWSSASNSGYTGSGGWALAVPANPGTPNLTLWVAQKGINAAATATSTVVDWTVGVTKAVWSSNGAAGVQQARAAVFTAALTIPAGPSGVATYTWATGSFGAAPSGWSLAPPPLSAGFTLYAAEVNLIDSAVATTTGFNWSAASISARGYAGSNGTAGAPGPSGGPGLQGASARSCYQRVPGNPAPLSGTISTFGVTSLPSASESNGAWGINLAWFASDPNPSSTSTLYQSDGFYDPYTGFTVWTTPYISSLKVGSLSAITASMGALTVDSTLSMSSGGRINAGAFTGFAWPASGTGFHLSGQGLLMGNANTGGFLNMAADGSSFDMGRLGGPRFTWTGSGSGSLVLSSASMTAATITGGLIQTATSGERIVLNEAGSNVARFYGNAGGGYELLGQVGATSYGPSAGIGTFGSLSSGNGTIGVLAYSNSATAVSARSNSGLGVAAISSSGTALQASNSSGAETISAQNSSSGPALVANSVSGSVAIRGGGEIVSASNGFSNGFRVQTTGGVSTGRLYYGGGALKLEAIGSGVPVAVVYNGSINTTFGSAGMKVETGFGCNGAGPQPRATSGGTLAGVIAALVANGILSS